MPPDETATARAADSPSTDRPSTDTRPDSTTIEPRETDVGAQGQGVYLPEEQVPEEGKKQPSTREAIAKAFDEFADDDEDDTKAKADKAAQDAKDKAEAAKVDSDDKDAKPADKAPDAEKAERSRGEDGKFAKAAETEGPDTETDTADGQAAERPEEARDARHTDRLGPPERFLPEAREKWANVPNAVKTDFHRIMQEVEAETEQHREASERYETIRQFDEIARANGRELKDSLARVVEIENALAQNPLAALDMILREAGPRKADGTPLTLPEVAQAVVQNPQAYQQMAARAAQPSGTVPSPQAMPQAQPQAQNPEIAELRAELQSMKTQSVMPLVERFAADHDDYHALKGQIAEILKDGVIDRLYGQGLSPEQKLAEAYRMAGGKHAPSQSDEAPAVQTADSKPEGQGGQSRPVDPDGQKSISGAPNGGQTAEPKRRFKTNREALEAAFASVRS